MLHLFIHPCCVEKVFLFSCSITVIRFHDTVASFFFFSVLCHFLLSSSSLSVGSFSTSRVTSSLDRSKQKEMFTHTHIQNQDTVRNKILKKGTLWLLKSNITKTSVFLALIFKLYSVLSNIPIISM